VPTKYATGASAVLAEIEHEGHCVNVSPDRCFVTLLDGTFLDPFEHVVRLAKVLSMDRMPAA
jgi:hypothetical protein